MKNKTWLMKDGLAEWDFKIDRKKVPLANLLEELILLMKQDFAEVTSVEIATYSHGDDAYVSHLKEQTSFNQLIAYVRNTNDIQDIVLFLKLVCFDWKDNTPQRIPLIGGGKIMIFDDEEEDSFYLTLMLDVDIYAPFYWERNKQTEMIAKLNGPRLKRVLKGIEQKLEAKLVEEEVPEYITEYINQIFLKPTTTQTETD